MRPLFLILAVSMFSQFYAYSQNFTKVVPQNEAGVYQSKTIWVDYDLDGDLDFLVTGQFGTNDMRTLLYENKGNDIFSPAAFNIGPQYGEAGLALTNTNLDERIDILIAGRRIGDATTNRISFIEGREIGFVDLGSLVDYPEPVNANSVVAGDLNNDGRMDAYISGRSGFNAPALAASIFLGQQNGSYKKITPSPIQPRYLGSAKVVDIDSDKDLDLIQTGAGNGGVGNMLLYLNDGIGNFSSSSAVFPKLDATSIDVADYDQDGDLDILVLGRNINLVSQVFIFKQHSGTFNQILIDGLGRSVAASAQWADYDNDGDSDILVSGQTYPTEKKLGIFINHGNDQFTELSENNFEAFGYGDAAWGDFDNDGDLDIVATGGTGNADLAAHVTLYKNNTSAKNLPPTKPGNLKVTSVAELIEISWTTSTDDFTSSNGLSYNLYLKETNTGNLVVNPFSNIQTGKRRAVDHGNCWLNKGWKFKNLADGTYEVAVQAIDASFEGSAWSEPVHFFSGIPQIPVGLTGTANNRSILLEWTDNSTNEQAFAIERKNSSGEFELIGSVPSNTTSYIDQELPVGAYQYRMRAINTNGNSDYTSTFSIAVTGLEIPPSNASAQFSADGVILTWVDNSNFENAFVVERRETGEDFQAIGTVEADIQIFVDNNPDKGNMSYRVKAINDLGESAYSNVVNVIVLGIENAGSSDVFLYPTCVSDEVTIHSKKFEGTGEVVIYDQFGRQQLSESILFRNSCASVIIRELNSGLYFLKARTNETNMITLKMIKK